MIELTNAHLFDQITDLPNAQTRRRYDSLVGLDGLKLRMHKLGSILLMPNRLDEWSSRHHGDVLPAVQRLRQRSPLILLAGDVGTGKTTLAETFADAVAREQTVQIRVMRLSLRSRGRGSQGDMTQMLGMAFDQVREKARLLPAVVLVIDEADALAQSRESGNMQHEDRAGVNALIRGIDTMMSEGLRVITIMCTNRLEAIDPAVRRRAADLFQLVRPGDVERRALLERQLAGLGLSAQQLDELSRLTGPRDGRDYGYTYSDIVDRLIPSAVMAAFPDRPLSYDVLRAEVDFVEPTRPFANEPD